MYEENSVNNNYNSASNNAGTASNTTGSTSYNATNGQRPQEYYYYAAGQPTQNAYKPNPPKEKKAKKGIGFAKRAAICLSLGIIFGLAAGCAFAVPTYLANRASAELVSTQTAETEVTAPAQATVPSLDTTTSGLSGAANTSNSSSDGLSIEAIAQNCLPSVVSITNKGVSEVRTMFGNYQQEYESSGSGIIIGENDTELLIVTNNHVVSGSNELSVVFSYDEDSEDPSVVSAKLKGYDSDKDLAVIAVSLKDLSEDTLSQIKIATIGDSSSLQLGQNVVAIGNALGYGQSVTTGIISALNREVSVSTEEGETITNKLIQTDAAINPGNSGGALLNMNGELIGINSVKVASSNVEGMGYAIPITDVQDIIGELMLKETRDAVSADEQGYIGIAGTDVSSDISSTYGIPVGVYVNTVYENSPAAAAGIQKGYVITKFDGSTVKTMAELKGLLTYYKNGETVKVVCQVQGANGYEEKVLNLTLGAKDVLDNASGSENAKPNVEEQPEQQAPSQGNDSFNYFWPFGSQW